MMMKSNRRKLVGLLLSFVMICTMFPAEAFAANDVAIDKPVAAMGLVANGEMQVGVSSGEGYTLSGTYEAKDAGLYSATAVLNDGYIWSDGTTESVEIRWAISSASAEGNEAPYSSVDSLDPGTYVVTANLYVPGEYNTVLPGINAFMTNGNVPPTSPVIDKALLTVDEGGTAILDLHLYNEVFLIEEIGSSENAEIIEATRSDTSYTGDNYSYTGRVTDLKVSLKDFSGLYQFTECEECATLLGQVWNVDLRIAVDFRSAHGAIQYTAYVDNPVYSEVNAFKHLKILTYDESLYEQLQNATLEIETVASGEKYEKVKNDFREMFVKEPTFGFYNVKVISNDGTEIDLSDAERIQCGTAIVDFEPPYEKHQNYLFFDISDEVRLITDHEEDLEMKFCFYTDTDLKDIVVVTDAEQSGLKMATAYEDETTGVEAVWQTSTADGVWIHCSVEPDNWHLYASKETEGRYFELAETAMNQENNYSEYEQPKVASIYRIAMYNDNKVEWTSTKDDSFQRFTLTLPETEGEVHLIYCEAVDAENIATADCGITATPENGTPMEIEYYSSENDEFSEIQKKMRGAYRTSEYYSGTRTNVYYFAVVTDSAVEIPAAATGLVYNGSEQIGVEEGIGYTLSGTYRAAEVGTYTAIATLSEGYTWKDGTTDSKTITWSIAQRQSGSSGGSSSQSKTQTVTANLYLPGENNQVLPGITVYLNNSNNPIDGTGTPTTPQADNAELKTAADGTMTLTLKITNPVFTLQKIGGCDNAEIISTKTSRDVKYQGTDSGEYTERISEITVKLKDKSGEYIFNDCIEYPTLLKQEWLFPLTLKVKFDGDEDTSLDSNDNTDTSGVTGGGSGGSSSTTADGVQVTVNTGADGITSGKITLPQDRNNGADVSIPADLGQYEGTVSVELTYEDGSKETVQASYKDGKVNLHINRSADFKILDDYIPTGGWTGIFKDVADSVYYAEAVRWAVSKGVTYGMSDDLFCPDNVCTRAQTVTFLWRAAGSPEPTNTQNQFSDVQRGAYYYNAVLWAVEEGITNGTSEDTFQPNAVVSRVQTAAFLWRMAGSVKTEDHNMFSDVDADSYYADAVSWALVNGITTGVSENCFAPDNGCSRAQIVTFLYRMQGIN